MELIKERQNVVTNYESSKETPVVTSISYQAKEGQNAYGSCEVRADGFSMSIHGIPGKTTEQVAEMVKTMFATLTFK